MDPSQVAPVTPEPVAEPAAPVVEPVAPVEPPVTPEPTPEETEASEWDDAEKEVYGDKKHKEEDLDEPAEPKEKPKTEEPNEEDPANKEQDAEQKPGDEADDETPADANSPEAIARAARAATRDYAQQVDTLKVEIKSKMYTDLPDTLQDADGDPIESIADVQKLINPLTGELFTPEEAGMWLTSAQQQFNQKHAEIEKQVEKIAEVSLDLKDQADTINARYGEFLKKNPEIRDKLWVEYEKTLDKDPESDIVIGYRMNLETFYELALKPLVAAATPQAPPVPTETPEEIAAREAKAKAEADAAKFKKRADRSDVFGPSDKTPVDDETAEWDEAAKTVFGNRV